MQPVFDAIMKHVPPAPNLSSEPLRLQIVNLGYDDYVGRLGIGRIYAGTINANQQVTIYGNDGKIRKGKISKLYTTLGLQRVETDTVMCGDIVTIA